MKEIFDKNYFMPPLPESYPMKCENCSKPMVEFLYSPSLSELSKKINVPSWHLDKKLLCHDCFVLEK